MTGRRLGRPCPRRILRRRCRRSSGGGRCGTRGDPAENVPVLSEPERSGGESKGRSTRCAPRLASLARDLLRASLAQDIRLVPAERAAGADWRPMGGPVSPTSRLVAVGRAARPRSRAPRRRVGQLVGGGARDDPRRARCQPLIALSTAFSTRMTSSSPGASPKIISSAMAAYSGRIAARTSSPGTSRSEPGTASSYLAFTSW